MEDGPSLFIAGSLNINGGQFSQVDEELDEEEEKQRELELQSKLKNAFDDLDEDSFQDHSSLYSENHHCSVSKGDSNLSENKPQNHSSYDKSYSNQPALIEENYCHSLISATDHTAPWSDESDLSGNFVAPNSLIQSPTRFPINVQSVVSHSDDSSSIGRCKENDFHKFSENHSAKTHPKRRENEIIEADYLSAETSYEQLQLLYEARGREIDRMSDELSKIQNFSHKEISALKNELAIMKADKETLSISKDQLKHLLSESELRIRDFVSEIKNKDMHIEHLENENKNLKLQVSTAQGTITSLEKQVSDLQSIDSITKSHQVHEEFLKKLQISHHQEVDELKRRLKSSSEKIEDYKLQINHLEDDLASLLKSKETALSQKSDDIRQLNSNLEAAQQQIKLLFDSRSNNPTNKEEDAEAIYKENESLKQELERIKTDLESYELLVKCGLIRSLSSSYNESVDQLSLCRALNFDEKISSSKLKTANNSSKGESMECNTGISEKLHKEFLKSLNCNKTYRKEVEQLRKTVSEKEDRFKVLEAQLLSLKDKMKRNSSTYNDKNVNIFIEENTCLKKEIYSLIQNKKELIKKGEEMLNELKKLLLYPSIDFNVERNSHALETIKGCISLLEKQKNMHHQMWEELRDDNIQLSSKQYLVLDKFEGLVKCLKEIKNNMKIKSLPDSSLLMMLKQLTETFYFNVSDLKEEMSHYLSNSTKLKNEMWTVKLNLEECKDEIFNLRGKISLLEEENKTIKNDKLQTIENCKENYLKFHEEAVSKLRNDLQAEYDTLYYSLKDEMEKLSKDLSEARKNYLEICFEKNQLEEMLRNKSRENKNSDLNIVQENEFLSNELIEQKKKCAYFEKENQNLKNQLEEILKSKLRESQNAKLNTVEVDSLLKKTLELEGKCAILEKENQIASTHKEGDVDHTGKENAQLSEAQQTIKGLKKQVQDLIIEVDHLNANHKEGEDYNKEGENTPNYLVDNHDSKVDISFSHILGTVENYKKLNEDYRDQIKKQKLFYEEQIDRLKVQVEFYSTNYTFIPTEPKKHLEKKREEVLLLSKKVEDLSAFLARTEAEKLELVKGHKEEVQELMKEVHDHEKNLKDFKHNSEIHLMSLMKEIHELNYKKTEIENEVIKLKHARTQLVDKYSKLHSKFIKLKNNFDKYRTWSESREAHLISEVDRVTELKTEENQSEFNSFKKWLGNSRSVLADGLSQVIDEMKSIPEKALPHSSLEPHIRSLIVIHEGLSKLDIRDKSSVRTR